MPPTDDNANKQVTLEESELLFFQIKGANQWCSCDFAWWTIGDVFRWLPCVCCVIAVYMNVFVAFYDVGLRWMETYLVDKHGDEHLMVDKDMIPLLCGILLHLSAASMCWVMVLGAVRPVYTVAMLPVYRHAWFLGWMEMFMGLFLGAPQMAPEGELQVFGKNNVHTWRLVTGWLLFVFGILRLLLVWCDRLSRHTVAYQGKKSDMSGSRLLHHKETPDIIVNEIRNKANSRIDICLFPKVKLEQMPKELFSVLRDLAKRLPVRLLTNETIGEGQNLKRFANWEISVKVSNKDLKHNFCVIDDQVLINSSASWDKLINADSNAVVTEDEDLVNEFKNLFADLWSGSHIH